MRYASGVCDTSVGVFFHSLSFQNKAVDNWVHVGAEAPPIFFFFLKDITHSTQHTTAYDV